MPKDELPSDDELQKRVEELLSRPVGREGRADNPEIPDDQLRDIEERVKKIRGSSTIPALSSNPQKARASSSGADYRGVGVGFIAAYALIGPILLGWGIGWLIDKDKPGPHTSQTYGVLIGTVFGFIAFVIALMRASKTDPNKSWMFAAGDAIGLFLGCFELVSFLVLSNILRPMAPSPSVVRFTTLFLLLKMPMVGIAVYAGCKLGPTEVAGFLFGIGLVYSLLVLIALVQRNLD